jgi:hypothetical protein
MHLKTIASGLVARESVLKLIEDAFLMLKKGKKQYRFENIMAPPKGLEPLTY